MRVDVLIVGGGASGTLVAAQLLRLAPKKLSVAIVEKTGRLAEGIAYSTREPEHLLNVPAGKMSALPSEPAHFETWLRAQDPKAHGYSFAPRMQYREYLRHLLATVEINASTPLARVSSEVVSIVRAGPGFRAELAEGEPIEASALVLALGNPLPSQPRIADDGIFADPRLYRRSPWDFAGLDDLPADADVLLLGTALTTVDTVLSLQRRAHRGTLHATSRHGLIPMRHGDEPPDPHSLAPELAAETRVRATLRTLRRAAKEHPWRDVVDGLRPLTAGLWQRFSATERARFLRHGKTLWEIHRHRMAPPVADTVQRALVTGRLQLHAGRVLALRRAGEDVEVRLRSRHDGELRTFTVQRVINCTGPSNLRAAQDPLLEQMVQEGLVAYDESGLGLDVEPQRLRVRGDGAPLHVLGPLLKGVLWESVAVPDLRDQAELIARELVQAHSP